MGHIHTAAESACQSYIWAIQTVAFTHISVVNKGDDQIKDANMSRASSEGLNPVALLHRT